MTHRTSFALWVRRRRPYLNISRDTFGFVLRLRRTLGSVVYEQRYCVSEDTIRHMVNWRPFMASKLRRMRKLLRLAPITLNIGGH